MPPEVMVNQSSFVATLARRIRSAKWSAIRPLRSDSCSKRHPARQPGRIEFERAAHVLDRLVSFRR